MKKEYYGFNKEDTRKGNKYTFKNVCLEDNGIILNDESQKIILNTRGIMKDLNEELLEFLSYVENSTDYIAEKSKGRLVKSIHEKVQEVKSDISVEVEFMTLLERDREKLEEGRKEGLEEGRKKGAEEGILLAKKVFKLLRDGYSESEIAKECNVSEDEVRRILE